MIFHYIHPHFPYIHWNPINKSFLIMRVPRKRGGECQLWLHPSSGLAFHLPHGAGANHGQTMGKPWENHGKTMGKPWENHGKTMGKPWVFPYDNQRNDEFNEFTVEKPGDSCSFLVCVKHSMGNDGQWWSMMVEMVGVGVVNGTLID